MKVITLVIDMAPPSANRIWRKCGRRMVLSEQARSFYQYVAAQVLRAPLLPKEWQYYAVEIAVAPTRRSGDVDNRIKPVLDALTRAHFWDDDKRVAYVACWFIEPALGGKTVIRISEAKGKWEAGGS